MGCPKVANASYSFAVRDKSPCHLCQAQPFLRLFVTSSKWADKLAQKSSPRKPTVAGMCAEQFDRSLGVFGKLQISHGLKIPRFHFLNAGANPPCLDKLELYLLSVFVYTPSNLILIMSWRRIYTIPRTNWFWANPHSHHDYCIYFISFHSHFIPITWVGFVHPLCWTNQQTRNAGRKLYCALGISLTPGRLPSTAPAKTRFMAFLRKVVIQSYVIKRHDLWLVKSICLMVKPQCLKISMFDSFERWSPANPKVLFAVFCFTPAPWALETVLHPSAVPWTA